MVSLLSSSVRSVRLAAFIHTHYIQPGHPFDLTKTRLQTAERGVYSGAVDVVKKTLARDGFSGCVCKQCFSSGKG